MNLNRVKQFAGGKGILVIVYLAFVLVYLLSLQYVPATITFEMKASDSDMGQLFYDTGTGYRETESIWFDIEEPERFVSYDIDLPGAKFSSFRIDPLTREGTFQIKSITIESMNYSLQLKNETLREALTPLNQVKLIYRDGVIHGISTGIDPQFSLDGSHIVNRLPLSISIVILLALLLLFLGVNKLFPGRYYEISFILFLILLAFPSVLPRLLSLALALIAVLIYGYLVYKIRNSLQELPLYDRSSCPVRTWLKNERIFYGACLGLIVALAFILRFANLTILDPYTDEYMHLLAAKNYLDYGSFQYTRASMVTYLAALFYQIGDASTFYEYVFWGRLPGVILGALTVIPLYYLTRKISQPVAIISTILWATSPWAIGVARTIREYAFYPLLILVALLFLINALELLLKFRLKLLPVVTLYLLPVVALLAYAYRFDTASTIKICGVILAAFAAYYLLINIKGLWKLAKTNKPALFAIITLAIAVVSLMLLYAHKSGHVSIDSIKLSDYWLRVFLVPGSPSTPMHWWGDYSFLAIAVFVLGIGFVYAAFRRSNYYFMHLFVFAVLLAFYMFFFYRYIRPRYIFYALPFFIPLVAVSVYALVDFARKLSPLNLKVAGSLAVALFIFQVFNYQNVLYPVLSDEHGYVRTTDEHHDSLKSTFELLEKEIGPDDVFITTIAKGMVLLSFDILNEKHYNYSYKSADRFEKVEHIIEENPQGFMILDWRRNGYFAEGYPHEGKFVVGETTVKVIMNKDGMQVYRWKR